MHECEHKESRSCNASELPYMLLHVTPDSGHVSCCWHPKSSRAQAGIFQGLGKANSVTGGQWAGKASLAALAMPLHDTKLGEESMTTYFFASDVSYGCKMMWCQDACSYTASHCSGQQSETWAITIIQLPLRIYSAAGDRGPDGARTSLMWSMIKAASCFGVAFRL